MVKARLILFAASLLLASLACAGPVVPVPTQDPNTARTLVAQIVAAASTQTALAFIPVGAPASPTATLLPPTLAPSLTATVSPLPVFTSTSAVPLVSVSVDTNCRLGPGRIYDRVGALLVGEVAEVVGRSASGNYWYIRNPDASGFCWLWGEYATLAGNLAALPVFTPPPTPTPVPDFTLIYAGLETCTGWWVDFRIENTGGATFRSIAIVVRDLTANVTLTLATDGFTSRKGCELPNTRAVFEPGDRRAVSMSPFTYDPTGHELRATINLCTNTGTTGLCTSKIIDFKP